MRCARRTRSTSSAARSAAALRGSPCRLGKRLVGYEKHIDERYIYMTFELICGRIYRYISYRHVYIYVSYRSKYIYVSMIASCINTLYIGYSRWMYSSSILRRYVASLVLLARNEHGTVCMARALQLLDAASEDLRDLMILVGNIQYAMYICISGICISVYPIKCDMILT